MQNRNSILTIKGEINRNYLGLETWSGISNRDFEIWESWAEFYESQMDKMSFVKLKRGMYPFFT